MVDMTNMANISVKQSSMANISVKQSSMVDKHQTSGCTTGMLLPEAVTRPFSHTRWTSLQVRMFHSSAHVPDMGVYLQGGEGRSKREPTLMQIYQALMNVPGKAGECKTVVKKIQKQDLANTA